MYKLNANSIIRQSDNASIPPDPANTDYAAYLQWLAAGNTPLPADLPNPNVAILAQIAQIEDSTMVPRVVREFMMRAAEKDAATTGVNLATDASYQRVKAVDDIVRNLRGRLS